ncbi:MAG: GspH/FimT family pseudopilin [Sneathiella sp.]
MVKTKTSAISKSPEQNGFTLIELLVCLAIIGLSLFLLVPNFASNKADSDIRYISAQMASELSLARSISISKNEPVAFIVNVKKRLFGITSSKYTNIPENVAVELLVGTTNEEISDEGTIVFFPDGTSTGGKISLSNSGRTQDIEVFWLTGQIHHAQS